MAKEKPFFHAIYEGFDKWNEFDGCATRSEFWYFQLSWFLFLPFFWVISAILSQIHDVLELLFVLIVISPYVSATIRRLHDSNHSGWNTLFALTPFGLWLLVLLLLPSQRFIGNKYWVEWCRYDKIRHYNISRGGNN